MILRLADYVLPNHPLLRILWIALMMVLVRIVAPAAWLAMIWSWS